VSWSQHRLSLRAAVHLGCCPVSVSGLACVCVLRGFSRQLELWRLLTLHGLWDFPRVSVCDQAVYDRLSRSPDAPMADLFVRITQAVRQHLAP
jgi:hypothetical protein